MSSDYNTMDNDRLQRIEVLGLSIDRFVQHNRHNNNTIYSFVDSVERMLQYVCMHKVISLRTCMYQGKFLCYVECKNIA